MLLINLKKLVQLKFLWAGKGTGLVTSNVVKQKLESGREYTYRSTNAAGCYIHAIGLQ